MTGSVIHTEELTKVYEGGSVAVRALDSVSVDIDAGEMVGVIGPSGSGKSTFLQILGCLDRPTSGRYALEGREIQALSARDLARVRRERLGFVFQGFNLLSRGTARENVELPLLYAGIGGRERRQRAVAALAAVGLERRLDHRPQQMSGGEHQRVAIARALVNNPAVLFADEPTGNLDSVTGDRIIELLFDLNKAKQTTLVVVTHDQAIASRCGRVIRIEAGRLVS